MKKTWSAYFCRTQALVGRQLGRQCRMPTSIHKPGFNSMNDISFVFNFEHVLKYLF